MMHAYDEIIDFIVSEIPPRDLVAFRPSEAVRSRVAELIAREKNEGLSADEKSDLDRFIQLEHLMRLAKARARARLQNE